MRSINLLATLLLSATAIAQSVHAPFNQHYQAVDLGQLPGVANYGGLCFAPNDPHTLLVSAYGSGQIVAVPVVRDASGRIQGFGASSVVANVGGNDGGLAVGPGNVLFFTWYGANRLGQIRPGSSVADRVDDLAPLGVGASVGACAFVPPGRAGAGRLKIASYGSSEWYDVPLQPDGQGTYAPGPLSSPIGIEGGPEGILYPPVSAPLLGDQVLVCEWNAGIAAYRTDLRGDPIPGTRQFVLSGAAANGGGVLDPVGGDFLFTFAGGHLLAMRPGSTCGSFTAYGAATPGATRTPTLTATGCARQGQQFTLQVDGQPLTFGALALGTFPASWQIAGVTVLTNMEVSFTHRLDAQGRLTVPITVPNHAAWGDLHLYFQAGYLEPTSSTGFSATAGLAVWIR